MNGNVIETKDALVSPMEPIHLGIFEGIKAYVEGDVLGKGGDSIAWFEYPPNVMRWVVSPS